MSQPGFLPNNIPPKKDHSGKSKIIQKRLESIDAGTSRNAEKVIDWNTVIYLCRIQCTIKEIAGAVLVSSATLAIRVVTEGFAGSWKEFYGMHRKGGHCSLRRQQWLSSEAGSIQMQIWLGKQYLGQTEKTHVTNEEFGMGAGEKFDLSKANNKELDDMEAMLTKCKIENTEEEF